MDCSPPGSSVHGDSPGKTTGVGSHSLLQAFFPAQVSCIAGRFFTIWATREALQKTKLNENPNASGHDEAISLLFSQKSPHDTSGKRNKEHRSPPSMKLEKNWTVQMVGGRWAMRKSWFAKQALKRLEDGKS